jgi:hypothetical protein
MNFITYSHRFADIIINSDYTLRKEIESVISNIGFDEVQKRYEIENEVSLSRGKKARVGMQTSLNGMFKVKFSNMDWETEKKVFGNKEQDLVIDFWKRKIGVDVAFNHRSFIGGDFLRLQAAGEIKNIINAGVYICATKEFSKKLSSDAASMVNFERCKWYLENFYAVLTVPIWLIGLEG